MMNQEYKNQQEEIKTIKPRVYNLKISDSDYQKLSQKSGSYNMTADELLENFVGDLVNGTYSNGSDERMLAEQWAERCGFSYDPEKTLIQFFCSGFCYSTDIENFIDVLSEIESAKDDLQYIEEQLLHPENQEWESEMDVLIVNGQKKEAHRYNSIEEFTSELHEEKEFFTKTLKDYENEIAVVKKEYLKYSGKKESCWSQEVESFKKWYINHYMIKE